MECSSPDASCLPCFLVGRVLGTEPAKLLVLHPPGLLLFVLGGRIVSTFAVGAL